MVEAILFAVGFFLGVLVMGLLLWDRGDDQEYSPAAPPTCCCGHQPWHHFRMEYPEGLSLAGCLCACDCSAYRPFWREVPDA